jgi:hypothetical protein
MATKSTQSAYGFAMVVSVCILAVLLKSNNPFGRDFIRVVIPSFLLLNSLQWAALPVGLALRSFGFGLSLVLPFAAIIFRSGVASVPELVSITVAVFTIQLILVFRFSQGDPPLKSMFLAQTMAFLFVSFLGAYITIDDVHFLAPMDPQFLFWSPLTAMTLWICGTLVGWGKWTRGFFIIAIGQIGIGLFDLGMGQNLTLMLLCAVAFFILAFGFLICWAKEFIA